MSTNQAWCGADGHYVPAAIRSVPDQILMSGHDWLGPQRAEAASDRILDAATELFVQHDVSRSE